MSYARLDYQTLRDPLLSKVFRHADLYLFDAYGMFRGLPPSDRDGGAGNFGIVLVLLCIVDGLATEVWPGRTQEPQQRFKCLIRSKLPWGPEGKGRWLDRGTAADQLYTEFRNPLVHELAQDKVASSRPNAYVEPIIGKWGELPASMQDIALIDALPKWEDTWPILTDRTDNQGNQSLKLTAAALYWAVKQLATNMAAEARDLNR